MSKSNNGTPDLGHLKGGFGKRQFLCPMRSQKNAAGSPMRVGIPLADEEGDEFIYVVLKNYNRSDPKQPGYELGVSYRENGAWKQPLKVAGLWSGSFNIGKAEPANGLSGLSNDKNTRFTLLPEQQLPDGSTGWALLQAIRGEAVVEDDGDADEFLDD
jgi:hypothetical protein